jgi:tRNA 2-thiocytidine biosynthesis protein TtcA
VVPSHLMDREQFGFSNLRATGQANPDGDKAFDVEPLTQPGVQVIRLG